MPLNAHTAKFVVAKKSNEDETASGANTMAPRGRPHLPRMAGAAKAA